MVKQKAKVRQSLVIFQNPQPPVPEWEKERGSSLEQTWKMTWEGGGRQLELEDEGQI